MATNSQVCPFGGQPETEPPSDIPELAARQITKCKTPEGLSGNDNEIPL